LALQISNKNLVFFFINEIFRLDRRKYMLVCNNLKARQKLLPSLEETCNYLNIGEEFVRRIEAQYSGFDINQRRADYHFFRERFQKAYAEILQIPMQFQPNTKLNENMLEEQFNNMFDKNAVQLKSSQLLFVAQNCYINLKYMTKTIWVELSNITNEEEFVEYFHNSISFTLGVIKGELSDMDRLCEIIRANFVFFVFNNFQIAEKFNYYNQFKGRITSINRPIGSYVKLIEIGGK
jgi:hypothetical protein